MSEDLKIRDGNVGGVVEEDGPLAPNASRSDGNWKATMQIKLILVCLAIVSIVVALDATILVAALPVSDEFPFTQHPTKTDRTSRHSRLHLTAPRTRLSGPAQRIF